VRALLTPWGLLTFGWGLLALLGERLMAMDKWPIERAAASGSLAVLLGGWALVAALPRTWRLKAAGSVLCASTGLAYIDTIAWRHYDDAMSVGDWQSFSNLPIIAPSVFFHVTVADLWLLLPLLAGAVALRWHVARPDAGAVRWQVVALVAAGAFAVAWPAASLVARDPDDVFEYVFQRRDVVAVIGLPAYHLYDVGDYAVRRIARARIRRTTDVKAIALQWPTPSAHRPLAGAAAGANVVIVSLESFQQFVVGLSIDGQPVAPMLTALAEESLQFTRVIDQTHRGTTADAEWLALQSMHPLAAGAVATRGANLTLHALPSVLRDQGYATRSASAEPPGYWNMGRFHKRLGFDASWFIDSFPPAPWIGPGLSDAMFLPVMGERLASYVEPFMAFMLTSSSHHPYFLPTVEQRLKLGALENTQLGHYLQTVHYTDRALGQFIAALRHSGRLDRTLLVLYGDHAAGLKLAPSEVTAALSADPEMAGAHPRFGRWLAGARLPLIIRLPSATVRGTRATVAGQADITPTVLGLLGVGTGAGPWMGRDLLAAHVRPTVFTREGLVADDRQIALPDATGGGCFTWQGQAMACQGVAPLREGARRWLAQSDDLIEGDLIAPLAAAVANRERTGPLRAEPVLVIAHRGDSLRLPENTREAIVSAFEHGADLVEIDIRRTRDGHAVVFHDDELERLAGTPGRAEDLLLGDFLRLDVGRWFHPSYAGTPPLTLQAALTLARPHGGVLLDLKKEDLGPAVVEAVRRASFPPRAILIGGWTPTQRQTFRRLLPGARLLKTEGPPQALTPAVWASTRLEGVWGWEFESSAPSDFVDAVGRSGLAPIAYTVNDEASMRRLIAAGVAGIETDDPALLRRIVDQLGVGTRRPAEASRAISDRW